MAHVETCLIFLCCFTIMELLNHFGKCWVFDAEHLNWMVLFNAEHLNWMLTSLFTKAGRWWIIVKNHNCGFATIVIYLLGKPEVPRTTKLKHFVCQTIFKHSPHIELKGAIYTMALRRDYLCGVPSIILGAWIPFWRHTDAALMTTFVKSHICFNIYFWRATSVTSCQILTPYPELCIVWGVVGSCT